MNYNHSKESFGDANPLVSLGDPGIMGQGPVHHGPSWSPQEQMDDFAPKVPLVVGLRFGPMGPIENPMIWVRDSPKKNSKSSNSLPSGND